MQQLPAHLLSQAQEFQMSKFIAASEEQSRISNNPNVLHGFVHVSSQISCLSDPEEFKQRILSNRLDGYLRRHGLAVV